MILWSMKKIKENKKKLKNPIQYPTGTLHRWTFHPTWVTTPARYINIYSRRGAIIKRERERDYNEEYFITWKYHNIGDRTRLLRSICLTEYRATSLHFIIMNNKITPNCIYWKHLRYAHHMRLSWIPG
jgi:hypothetical protein